MEKRRNRWKTCKDIFATAASRLGRQATLFATTVIASRTLTKEELGAWTVIYVVLQFGLLLGDSGIPTFIVRDKLLNSETYSSAFFLGALINGLVAAATLAALPPLTEFLGYAEYRLFFFYSTATLVPTGITAIIQARLRREKNFTSIFFIDAITSISYVTGIFIVLRFHQTLAAFIFPQVFGSCVGFICAAYANPIPPLKVTKQSSLRILNYSSGLIGFSIINYWGRYADHLLIAKHFSPAELSTYSIGYRIMMLPVSVINSVAVTVSMPYLAPHQENHQKLRKMFYWIIILILSICTAPMTLIWLYRESIISLVFGQGWIEASILLNIFAPLAIFQSAANPVGLCYQITGATKLFLVLGLFQNACILTGVLLGVALGSIHSVAYCYAGTILAASAVTLSFGLRTIGSNFLEWVKVCSPFFCCIPICYAARLSYASYIVPHATILIDILLALTTSSFASIIASRLFAGGPPLKKPGMCR